MSTQFLEIQPRELKFSFELKKQSSCSIRLVNNTHDYVAFKVKTTSPKKYCVRPNVGIVMPKSSCEFTVMMQAQIVAPPDMLCKDKFLIQSTIVPVGTTDADISSSMFAKADGRYIQENKLKVALISPPHSPMSSPIKGTLKQGPAYEAVALESTLLRRDEVLTPPLMVPKAVEESKMLKVEEVRPPQDVLDEELKPTNHEVKDEESKPKMFKVEELRPTEDVLDEEKLEPSKHDIKDEDSKSKMFKVEELRPTEDVLDEEKLKLSKHDIKHDESSSKMFIVEELRPTRDILDEEELQLAKHEDKDEESRFKMLKVEELRPPQDVLDEKELKPAKHEVKEEESTPPKDAANNTDTEPVKDAVNNEDLKIAKDAVNDQNLKPTKDAEWKSKYDVVYGEDFSLAYDSGSKNKLANDTEFNPSKHVESQKIKAAKEEQLAKDIEEMKSKLIVLESKLFETGLTISKLTEERKLCFEETRVLREELAVVKSKTVVKQVQVGFPLLFVCMVALIGIFLGYRLHL